MPHTINHGDLSACANMNIAKGYIETNISTLSESEIAELLYTAIKTDAVRAAEYILIYIQQKLDYETIVRICSSVDNKNSLLNYAAINGDRNVFLLVLEYANPYFQDEAGKRAADHLYTEGHIDLLQQLAEQHGFIGIQSMILLGNFNLQNKFLAGNLITSTHSENNHIDTLEKFQNVLETLTAEDKHLIQLRLEQFFSIASEEENLINALNPYYEELKKNLGENFKPSYANLFKPSVLNNTPILTGHAQIQIDENQILVIGSDTTNLPQAAPTEEIKQIPQECMIDVSNQSALMNYEEYIAYLKYIDKLLSDSIKAFTPPWYIKLASLIRTSSSVVEAGTLIGFGLYNAGMVIIEIFGNAYHRDCVDGYMEWPDIDGGYVQVCAGWVYGTDNTRFTSTFAEEVNQSWGKGEVLFASMLILNGLVIMGSGIYTKINQYNIQKAFLEAFGLDAAQYYDDLIKVHPNLIDGIKKIDPCTVLKYFQTLIRTLISNTRPSIGAVYPKFNPTFGFLSSSYNKSSRNRPTTEQNTENSPLLNTSKQL